MKNQKFDFQELEEFLKELLLSALKFNTTEIEASLFLSVGENKKVRILKDWEETEGAIKIKFTRELL